MTTMTEDADIAALSFEQALSELERIVAELESGDADLERAVDVYRRGAQLRAHCETKLKAAQLKVESIILGPPNSGPANSGPANSGPANSGRGGPMGVEPATFA
jgi:exodeoxyribonuclease VII small subunit